MKYIKATLLALVLSLSLFSINVLGVTFQTNGNNSWSPYNPGVFYNGSDEFIISHSVALNGFTLAPGGKMTIKNGGSLKLNWSANFNASSEIIIENGGVLKLQNITTVNFADIVVYGQIITSNGSLVNYGGGEIVYLPGADWVMNQYSFANYGTILLNEDADWKNGTVSLVQGQVTINAELKIKNMTLSNNATIIGIGQVKLVGGQGTFSSTGTINGCQGNACIPPSTIGQTTYLATSFVDDGTIPEQYDGSTFPSSGCGVALQVKENITFSSNFEVGELIVSPGVTVLVEQGVSLSICNDVVNEGTVIIENGAALVQNKLVDENIGNGNFYVYRNATTNPLEYHSVSSPIEQAYLPDVFQDENPCDLFCFDGASQSWLYDYADGYSTSCGGNPVTFSAGGGYLVNGADGWMDIGHGYFITGDLDGQKIFDGQVNNGTITASVYETSLGNQPNWNDDDWNLLGNPYPSAIDLDQFYTMNQNLLTGNFYFWVDDNSSGVSYDQSNDYAVYNSFSSIAANGSPVPTKYLSSCQGFWAVAHTDGQVTFNNSMRVADNNSNFYKQSQSDNNSVVWINLINEYNNFNQMCIGFSESSTDTIDVAQDAPKSDAGTAVAIGSRLLGHNYSIQAIAAPQDFETKWVDLFVSTKATGEHTFKASEFQNIPSNLEVWLFDSLSNTLVDLQQDSYTLILDSNVYESRFKIKFEQTGPMITSVNESLNSDLDVNIFINDLGLEVQEKNQDVIDKVIIYNTLGQLMIQQNVNSSNVSIALNSLSDGAYVVHVFTSSGYIWQEKVIWSR